MVSTPPLSFLLSLPQYLPLSLLLFVSLLPLLISFPRLLFSLPLLPLNLHLPLHDLLPHLFPFHIPHSPTISLSYFSLTLSTNVVKLIVTSNFLS